MIWLLCGCNDKLFYYLKTDDLFFHKSSCAKEDIQKDNIMTSYWEVLDKYNEYTLKLLKFMYYE